MSQGDLWLNSGAHLDEHGTYRYVLWRRWGLGKCMTFIGLNPSTADAVTDDPTIRKCQGFAKRLGFDAFYMLNLFAFRSSSPLVMKSASDPVGPRNDEYLAEYSAKDYLTVAMWGRDGAFQGRDVTVAAMFPYLKCLRLNGNGSPGHVLYIPYTAPLLDYKVTP